jgi:hypothetical protein
MSFSVSSDFWAVDHCDLTPAYLTAVILLYQRWIYRVDYTRANEYGQVLEEVPITDLREGNAGKILPDGVIAESRRSKDQNLLRERKGKQSKKA